MQTAYMVVARDGQEYGPMDRDTIQRWYYEGRLDGNSKVYAPGKHKFRMKEMFDLTLWDNPALIRTPSAETLDFKPTMLSDVLDQEQEKENVRTPGMLAAAILLFVQAGIEVLSLATFAVLKLQTGVGPRDGVALIFDVIVAVGLIRGKERFRKWGLVRAILGGVVYGVLTPLGAMTPYALILGFFQLVFAAGIAALLAGEAPSKKRVAAGVVAVLLAWSGVITTEFVTGLVQGMNQRRDLAKYEVPGAGFEDTVIGVSVKLPPGWSLLNKENPIVSLPDAEMVAVHNDAGCFAALMVEPASVALDSLDDYLTLVLTNRRESSPSIRDLGRNDVDFGNNPGRRLETSWTNGDLKFRGFTTACKAGESYYLLSGWCLDEVYKRAFLQFQSLEQAFLITGTHAAEESIKLKASEKSKGSRSGAGRK
jgi:hypothetical protein